MASRPRSSGRAPKWCHRPKGSTHWHYDFRIRGDRYRASTGTASPEEAELIVQAVRRRILLGDESGPAPITIDNAFGRYLLEHAQFLPSLDDVTRDAVDIAAAFGKSTYLHEIDDDRLAEVIARWRAEPDRRYRRRRRKEEGPPPLISPRTVNARVERLRAVINMAGEKWNKAVPKIAWKRHKLKEPPPRERYLAPQEAERLIELAAPHLRPGIRMALFTGLRLDNVIGLDWRQVDLRNRQLHVVQKGGERHTVPLIEPLFIMLANMGPKDSGPVFTYTPPLSKRAAALGYRPKPRPIKSWRRAWRTALRRAGIEDFRWHDLRHTCASWMVWKGVDLATVRKVLGHRTIATTMRYAHLQTDAQRRALDAIWSGNHHRGEAGEAESRRESTA